MGGIGAVTREGEGCVVGFLSCVCMNDCGLDITLAELNVELVSTFHVPALPSLARVCLYLKKQPENSHQWCNGKR